MTNFSIVVAMDQKLGIGKDGQLPWHLPPDLKHFRDITSQTRSPDKQNIVIMGRVTWDSLPDRFKPLPNRINVVLSRNKQLELPNGVILLEHLNQVSTVVDDEALAVESLFVIGGQQIYEQAVKLDQCQSIHVTHLIGSYDCDTFFPRFEDQFMEPVLEPVQEYAAIEYYFATYQRTPQA